MTDNDINRSTGHRGFAARIWRKLRRLALDRPYRHQRWLGLMRPEGAFQPSNDTRVDRYPRIFSFVQAQLGADSAVNILSFGCSTGEEVFSLRQYFPRATIKGIDINSGNVAICKQRLRARPDAGLSFFVSHSTRDEPAASYDAIFAMAVLRHGGLAEPGVTRCDHLLPFQDFATAVADFRRCLKPGGLLVVRHSNFRLGDTPDAGAFAAILSVPRQPDAKRTPLFGPDNRLMPGIDYPDTVFRKIAAD